MLSTPSRGSISSRVLARVQTRPTSPFRDLSQHPHVNATQELIPLKHQSIIILVSDLIVRMPKSSVQAANVQISTELISSILAYVEELKSSVTNLEADK